MARRGARRRQGAAYGEDQQPSTGVPGALGRHGLRADEQSAGRVMNRLLLERLERLCNRCVEESTAAAELVEGLDGHTFAVQVEGLGIELVLAARGCRLTLAAGDGTPASAAIRGGPLDLLRLLPVDTERSLTARLKTTGAVLTGKVEVAERFAEVLRLARPDFEEELSRWIGDIAAHQLGLAAGGVRDWLRRAADALTTDTAEYLQEETRTLPSRHEVRSFCTDVERLRDDVERAAARLERLARARGSR
jgi:ubiquinone biosynthesis accessory factor UbiJ